MTLSRSIIFSLCLTALAGVGLAADLPQIINVNTAHSSLTLCVETNGRVYQLGYGKLSANPDAPEKMPARETEFLPCYGDGFVLEPAIQATHADGNNSTDLIYVHHETSMEDTNVSLTRIELKDRFYPFAVTVFLRTYRNEDVIEAWTEIRHDEGGDVTLYRFASSSPLIQGKEHWLTQFHGDWSREAEMSEEKLSEGIKILDSKIGVRASQYRIPSFILAQDGPAREESGEVYGGSLKWSGSYQLAFDVDWNDRLRVLAGINPFGSQYHLAKGRSFTTPAMLWTWSDHGKGQVSRNFHSWARRYGIRDGDKPRPVLLNNWEATYFNFNEHKLVSLLDQAKELGVELFLLDDGWFGNKYPRNNDHAGLGDWQANTAKLPHGLSYLAAQAAERGLRFGIWLEPEMVNPESELYEAHPDWAIGEPHREPELMRHQLDLDLSNPAVAEFSWKVIDDTLGQNADDFPPVPATAKTNTVANTEYNFNAIPISQVLDIYGNLIGRTLLRPSYGDGSVPGTITITLQAEKLTQAEAITTLETALRKNHISIVPVGDKFAKLIIKPIEPEAGISYVKWDANRYVTQPGSTYLSPGEQSHLLIDYNLALYDIMAKMAQKYPQVMAMLCSGGSGRADYGALKYFDSFWPSDNTDPARRVFIQWGFSHFFPAYTMCAHVTRMGKRPLKFTLDVAMSADLGFDVDLAKTSPSNRQTMARAVQLYKTELRDIVSQGDLYRLESPYDGPRSCIDYVSPDRSKALLFVYQLEAGKAAPIKPRGLDPERHYTVHEVNLPEGAQSQTPATGQSIDGATLMRDGLIPPCKNSFDSVIIELW